MGPLWLVIAGLALWGCASRRSEEIFPQTPPAPPPSPCKDSFAGSNLGGERLFPCAPNAGWKESPYFRDLPDGPEWNSSQQAYLASLTDFARTQGVDPIRAIRLARKIMPADLASPLGAAEKTEALSIAVTLLSVQKLNVGFFSKEYGSLVEKALQRVEEGKLRIRKIEPNLSPIQPYSVEDDAIQFRSAFPPAFSSEVRQEILGSLYDLNQDGLGTPTAKVDHAFWRCTLQALYHLESNGLRLDRLTLTQFENLLTTQFQTQENGPLKGLALRTFYEGLQDPVRRFTPLGLFARSFEEIQLQQAFRVYSEKTAKDSPDYQSWDEMLVDEMPKVKRRTQDPKALQVQIQKLEREKKEKLAAFQEEAQKREKLKDANNKKSGAFFSPPTEAEIQADLKLRKRFDALLQTWSALVFFKEAKQSSEYAVKEIGSGLRPEEEMIHTLAPYGILGAEKIPFNQWK